MDLTDADIEKITTALWDRAKAEIAAGRVDAGVELYDEAVSRARELQYFFVNRITSLLSFIADIAGLLGGMSVAAFNLDIPPQAFISRLHDTIQLRHFVVGMVKAPVFAIVIGLIGCLEGLQVKGTAQSVGERTTSSVVQTISLVIVLDAIAAIWFMNMGW